MSDPHKSECPAATEQNAKQITNSAIVTPAEFLSNHTKRFATLQAKFALLGHALEKLTSADKGSISYEVSNWGQSRAFADLGEVNAFLILIGGRP